ncbi:MAG TPA: TonB family protein, partial [Gemmatimonadaceae bacterium]|nr:TonB family protein [Gemmatimonadaceae bacterium]
VSFTWETLRMSINLIESGHRTQKSVRSTFVSVAVHACLITLAVYASASATEVRPTPESYVDIFPPTPTRTTVAPPHPTHRITTRSFKRSPDAPRDPISIPVSIPTTLPPIGASTAAIDDSTLFGSGSNADSGVSGTGAIGESGEPLFAAQVEKPATPRYGNPSPRYPSLLESSRVEGTVVVQFVVDTLGVAEMSSFKVLEATNDLFAEATRATLAKWRFYPAEAGGRKVKQIVQLPLRFVAPHH